MQAAVTDEGGERHGLSLDECAARRFLFFWMTQMAAGANPAGWVSSAVETPSIRRQSLTDMAYLLSASLRRISWALAESSPDRDGTRNGWTRMPPRASVRFARV